MPLSEDGQRRLDEIERALHHDDPKFAARQTIAPVWLRRTVAAASAVLIGMVLLVVGLITTQAVLVVGVIVSVTGVLTMVGGASFITRRPPP
jgi:uncharacterized membrane protein HdeD (DUF308 family)